MVEGSIAFKTSFGVLAKPSIAAMFGTRLAVDIITSLHAPSATG